MSVWYTNAPEEYDYSYVETVHWLPEGSSWRVIKVTDEKRFWGFQKPRYSSGMYVAVSASNESMLKTLGVPAPGLNEILGFLGFTTHDGPFAGQKSIVESDTSFVVYTGRAHEVWEWLRERGMVE